MENWLLVIYTACMKKISIIVLASFFLAACGGPKPIAEIKIPFEGESVMDTIGEDAYRFFRYEEAETAQSDIEKVALDGKSIDGKTMPWDGPVHIYHLAKRIVIYVGENEETTKAIENVFGPQVAGD